MATALGNVSLQNGSRTVTCFEKARNWVQEHPTTVKILKIAGLILGIGLLLSLPFASSSLGAVVAGGLAAVGATAIVASLLLFACHPKTAASPVERPIADLWGELGQKTEVQEQGLEFLPAKDLNHRFANVFCPQKTAILVGERYLHANRVGEGIAQRSFVATQAPLEQDYAIFWKAIFENGSTIFDLTTIDDQTKNGVTKYYPDQLNETMKYGSMSVKLVEINDRTYTYQIENTETRTVKNSKRYHYANWMDLSAVSLPILRELVQAVETLSPDPKEPTWIHCRAGVGRTGTLITALVLKEKMKRGEISKANLDASLVDVLIKLREQRGPIFVQTQQQLDLLRRYAESLMAVH